MRIVKKINICSVIARQGMYIKETRKGETGFPVFSRPSLVSGCRLNANDLGSSTDTWNQIRHKVDKPQRHL